MGKLLTYLLPIITLLLTSSPVFGQKSTTVIPDSKTEKPVYLNGTVKDAITKVELPKAKIVLYNADGTPRDTINGSTTAFNPTTGEEREISHYFITLPRRDTVITFDVICPGYEPQTVTYEMKKVGKRESNRTVPVVFLERAAHRLGEVTVTASKIKFYNKGDTIVYNADAFQLAEGSMLDALIVQLPGVELKDDGRIFVNGEYVESLLLNGKQFLDGQNKLVLENIGAYTVKSVEVYKGQTDMEKWINDPTADKHLTMDVKLKKEYMTGWIVNAQGGAGTEDRYTGRLFTSLFTPTTSVTLLGNINNLNDNRKPGKSDTWTPEMMPSGTKRYKMLSLDYNYRSPDEKQSNNGYITFEHTGNNNRSTTSRENFLAGGNTFDNIFSRSRNSDLKLETRHYFRLFQERYAIFMMGTGRYIRKTNKSDNLSATFREEQQDITAKAIEALYSDGTPERLDAVINRSITRSDGSSREGEVQFYPGFRWKVNGTNDNIYTEFGVKYQEKKEERWRDYLINYGADPNPAVTRRQYFDNSPNRTLTLISNTNYYTWLPGGFRLAFGYEYRFENRDRDSYMYALDRLEDMGIYGTVPAGYLDTFDPANSYTSRLMMNKHSFEPEFGWYKPFKNNNMFRITIAPQLSLLHSHLDYRRNNRSYQVSRDAFVGTVKSGKAEIELEAGASKGTRGRTTFRHTLAYQYSLDTKTPDLTHTLDIEDDTDPLNISLGNPDLKSSFVHSHNLKWAFKPTTRHLNNTLSLTFRHTTDEIVRGYTYDTTTGVRRTRSYNVNGNRSLSANNSFNIQFGPKDQFTITSSTGANTMRYADMIGVNLQTPVRSIVNTVTFNEDLKFSWQIGKQNLGLKGSLTNRHTTSSREDFTTLDANHFNGGFLGQFTLPYGFGINTDFMFYTRRGYGSKQLDTTDAIWNIRLTYTPTRSWVFMVDAFDMLHQLSNVNYAVSASGRTVTYTNALPRYILFSAQYRFNIQPKKR